VAAARGFQLFSLAVAERVVKGHNGFSGNLHGESTTEKSAWYVDLAPGGSARNVH
jgi:hypothetical protein